MDGSRAALGVLAGALSGSLLLTGCGGSGSEDRAAGREPTSSASATPSSGATATGSPTSGGSSGTSASATPTRGASGSAGAMRSVVSGKVTQVRDRTARVSGTGGVVAISWASTTVIVDSVSARAGDVKVGDCVLVLPPADGPSPSATAMTAGTVRLVASSPSCPRIPGTQPTASGADGDGTGGSLTIRGGQGVIGSVSKVSTKGFTLRSRSDAKTRTVTVTTSKATRYLKAGDHPRAAVEVGRCATVWGRQRNGHVVATRIRVSDPVDGSCEAPVS